MENYIKAAHKHAREKMKPLLNVLQSRAKPIDHTAVLMFLIWSNEHNAWWRPNSRGYTDFAKAAGVYSFEEARGISWQGRDGWHKDGEAPDELVVPIEAIPEAYRPDVPVKYNCDHCGEDDGIEAECPTKVDKLGSDTVGTYCSCCPSCREDCR